MFAKHPDLKVPPDNATLWRYFDLPKFLFMLEKRSLFFARLRTLKDPFEGHPPKHIVDLATALPAGLAPEHAAHRQTIARNNLRVFRSGRDIVCATCWHINERESAAMWDLYLPSGAGIAIRTTYERFRRAFHATDIAITGALVEYIDYDSHPSEDLNVLHWAAMKRHEFAHEREFRGLMLHPVGDSAGTAVKVDLDVLVEDIFLSPLAAPWLTEVVEAILKRFGIPHELRQSKLTDEPGYYPPESPTNPGL